MANFIEEKKIINTYVENYVNTTTDFSKYIEGSPTFVTYYSKDINASTEDIGLAGAVEIIGNDSPIRFNKINNFPTFNMEEINLDFDYSDEDGADTSLESSLIVLPGTLKPLPDDYFTVDYMERKILFRVSKVETGSINNKVIYKVYFYYSGGTASLEALEEKQVTKNYEVLYDNIGKDGKIIIEEEKFILLQKLKTLSKEYKKIFIRKYFNKKLNTFLFFNRDKYLYDKYFIDFLIKTRLFIERKTFMSNIVIEHLVEYSLDDDYLFENTIYNSILNRDKNELNTFSYNSSEIINPYCILNTLRNRYEVESINYIRDNNDEIDPDFTLDENNNGINKKTCSCKHCSNLDHLRLKKCKDPFNDCDRYNYHPHPHENVPFYDVLYKNNLKKPNTCNLNIDNIIDTDDKLTFNSLLIQNIIDNILFEDNNLYNVIIKFLNNYDEEEIIQDLFKVRIKDYSSYEIFTLLSCLIYIIDYMANYLQNK